MCKHCRAPAGAATWPVLRPVVAPARRSWCRVIVMEPHRTRYVPTNSPTVNRCPSASPSNWGEASLLSGQRVAAAPRLWSRETGRRGNMRHSALRLLAASSLLLVGLAHAARRPQYGGTLHVAMQSAPSSLDPAALGQLDAVTCRNLSSLLFDTLVTTDDLGRVHPALALNWQADPGNQRWQFRLRRGVAFDDGSLLTPAAVAASLRAGNPNWTIYALDDSVAIELNSSNPWLPAELALSKNSIVKRLPSKVSGTGPFRISDWQPGKKLVIAANEDYWGGRPFVNSVEILLGNNTRDQLMLLELGRADLIEIPPEQARRIAMEGRRVSESASLELLALVFTHQQPTSEDQKLLDAVAL